MVAIICIYDDVHLTTKEMTLDQITLSLIFSLPLPVPYILAYRCCAHLFCVTIVSAVRGHYIGITIHLHTPSRPLPRYGTGTVIRTFLSIGPKCISRYIITCSYQGILFTLYLDQLLSGPRVATWGLLYIGSRCHLQMTPLN